MTPDPDYEKQALGAALMESIQGSLGLRATILALQAENVALKAAAAKPDVPAPADEVETKRPMRVGGAANR